MKIRILVLLSISWCCLAQTISVGHVPETQNVVLHLTDSLYEHLLHAETYNAVPAEVSVNNGTMAKCDLKLWGVGSLALSNSKRRSFHLQSTGNVILSGGQPRSEIKSVVLLALYEDSNKLKYRTAVRMMRKLDIWFAYTSFCHLYYERNGQLESQGLYLLVQHPIEAIQQKYGESNVGGVAQRLHNYPSYRNSLAELPNFSHGGPTDDLYKSVLENPSSMRENMDWTSYFKWLAFNSVVMNRDYVDEGVFFFLKDNAHFLRVMPWDYTSILENCPYASADNNLFYCVTSPLDIEVTRHWRRGYAQILLDVVMDLQPEDVHTAFRDSAKEAATYCSHGNDCETFLQLTFGRAKAIASPIALLESGQRSAETILERMVAIREALLREFSCQKETIAGLTREPVLPYMKAFKRSARESRFKSLTGEQVSFAQLKEQEFIVTVMNGSVAGSNEKDWCLISSSMVSPSSPKEDDSKPENMDEFNALGALSEWLRSLPDGDAADYVILREPSHSKRYPAVHVDVLVQDFHRDCRILTRGSAACDGDHSAGQAVITVAAEKGVRIGFDFRSVGDGYFDRCWEEEMLRQRTQNANGLYILSPVHQFYSLLYHVTLQKLVPPAHRVQELEDVSEAAGISEFVYSASDTTSAKLAKWLTDSAYGCPTPLDSKVQWRSAAASDICPESNRLECSTGVVEPHGDDAGTVGTGTSNNSPKNTDEQANTKSISPVSEYADVNAMFTHWKALNVTYAILRNYEVLSSEVIAEAHPDIDLIIGSYLHDCPLSSGASCGSDPSPTWAGKYVTIGGKRVKLDYRYVGDNYYDKNWEKSMLETAVEVPVDSGCVGECATMRVLNTENYYYSLLYHALLHKGAFAADYKSKLNAMSAELAGQDIISGEQSEPWLYALDQWMSSKGYTCPRPLDTAVAWQSGRVVNERLSYKRPDEDRVAVDDSVLKKLEQSVQDANATCDVHMTILWPRAHADFSKILTDMESEHLEVMFIVNMTWPDQCRLENYVHLYGETHRKVIEPKIGRCYTGYFQVIFVKDCEAVYVPRGTSDPNDPYRMVTRNVNKKLFDLKQRYREWIGQTLGTGKIDCFHSTVTGDESGHDIPVIYNTVNNVRIDKTVLQGIQTYSGNGVCA